MLFLYLLFRVIFLLIGFTVIFGILIIYFVVWGLCKIGALIVEAAEEGPPARMQRGDVTTPQARWSNRR